MTPFFLRPEFSKFRTWFTNQWKWHGRGTLFFFLRILAPLRVRGKIEGFGNSINFEHPTFEKLEVNISGNTNTIFAANGCAFGTVRFFIFGNQNTIRLGERVRLTRADFYIFGNGSRIEINEESTAVDVDFAAAESGTRLLIGKRCMLATKIEIRTGDSHGIYDRETGVRLNPGRDVVLGNHVWVGTRCLILKGAVVPDGCVVAGGAIVNKEFDHPHSILAGVPAREVRQNVEWRHTWN